MPQPGTGAQGGGEIAHAAQNLVDIGGDILAIDVQVIFYRQAQGSVQDGAILSVVEVLACKHGIAAAFHVGGAGYLNQVLEDVFIDEVFG